MKNLLVILMFLTFHSLLAQEVSVTLSTSCYKKGYLECILTFENTSNRNVSFTSDVLNSRDESPYDDSYNIDLYKNGAILYSLFDEKRELLNWFSLPLVSYKCKRDKNQFSNFTLKSNEKRSFPMVLCLKKYEKIIKSLPLVEIRFDIIQNLPNNGQDTFFNGILKTNSAYFKGGK